MSDYANVDWITRRPAVAVEPRRSYVTLPAFSYSDVDTALEASYIRVQFCYSATNNFTINTAPTQPSGCDFILCIRYRIGDTVYRYKLWDDNEYLPQVSRYRGQVIKKNFVLEVWTTPGVATVTLTAAQQMLLSIRSAPTNFRDLTVYENATYTVGASLENTGVTAPPTVGMEFWYRADNVTQVSGNVDALLDKSSNARDLAYSVGKPLYVATDPDFNNLPVIQLDTAKMLYKAIPLGMYVKNLYVVLKQNTHTTEVGIIDLSGTTSLVITQLATPDVDKLRLDYTDSIGSLTPVNSTFTELTPYILQYKHALDVAGQVDLINTVAYLKSSDLQMQLLENAEAEHAFNGTISSTNILLAGKFTVAEMIGYSTDPDEAVIGAYLGQRYANAIPLPMDFASTNAWLDNV